MGTEYSNTHGVRTTDLGTHIGISDAVDSGVLVVNKELSLSASVAVSLSASVNSLSQALLPGLDINATTYYSQRRCDSPKTNLAEVATEACSLQQQQPSASSHLARTFQHASFLRRRSALPASTVPHGLETFSTRPSRCTR